MKIQVLNWQRALSEVLGLNKKTIKVMIESWMKMMVSDQLQVSLRQIGTNIDMSSSQVILLDNTDKLPCLRGDVKKVSDNSFYKVYKNLYKLPIINNIDKSNDIYMKLLSLSYDFGANLIIYALDSLSVTKLTLFATAKHSSFLLLNCEQGDKLKYKPAYIFEGLYLFRITIDSKILNHIFSGESICDVVEENNNPAQLLPRLLFTQFLLEHELLFDYALENEDGLLSNYFQYNRKPDFIRKYPIPRLYDLTVEGKIKTMAKIGEMNSKRLLRVKDNIYNSYRYTYNKESEQNSNVKFTPIKGNVTIKIRNRHFGSSYYSRFLVDCPNEIGISTLDESAIDICRYYFDVRCNNIIGMSSMAKISKDEMDFNHDFLDNNVHFGGSDKNSAHELVILRGITDSNKRVMRLVLVRVPIGPVPSHLCERAYSPIGQLKFNKNNVHDPQGLYSAIAHVLPDMNVHLESSYLRSLYYGDKPPAEFIISGSLDEPKRNQFICQSVSPVMVNGIAATTSYTRNCLGSRSTFRQIGNLLYLPCGQVVSMGNTMLHQHSCLITMNALNYGNKDENFKRTLYGLITEPSDFVLYECHCGYYYTSEYMMLQCEKRDRINAGKVEFINGEFEPILKVSELFQIF